LWLHGEWVSAAEAPTQSGVSDQLIIMIGGVVTAAIVALGGVLVAIVNRGGAKTAPSPPGPMVAPGSDHVLYERTAVLTQRADDNDERDDVQDRRLDQIERVLDLDNPEWRRQF
jgi:hypothetical protein